MLPLPLALVPCQIFTKDVQMFQWKCPLQKKNGLALSNMKFQACCGNIHVMAQRLRAPDTSSCVSDWQSVGSSPIRDTCVLKQDTAMLRPSDGS